MNDNAFPTHLFFPLTASVLFATGLIVVKKAGQRGAGSWSVTFVANLCAALVFSILWLLGGATQPWSIFWQPFLVALLYIGGQVCTFIALDRGDVSVAAPIFSVKVLMVAFFLTVVAGEPPSEWVWLAACGATLGVALIQRTGARATHRRVLFTICFAMLAATLFAMFDVLVQRWAPAWGPGRFLPWVFIIAAFLSLGFLPWVDLTTFQDARIRRPMILGGLLIALQSLCLVVSVAMFGDAARINVVYALRGVWGVLLAWIFATWLGAGEASESTGVMGSRLLGAIFVTAAVVVAIVMA